MAAVLAWASSASGVLWIGRQLGAWQYLAIGNGIGCLGQIAVYGMLGRGPRELFRLPPRLWAVALLGFVFYSACYASGLLAAATDAQAVGVGLMNHLWPVLTVGFSLLLVPDSRWSARLGLALGLSLAGLAVANWREIAAAGAGGAALPYALGGLAGISWALYSALIARWRGWGHRYATAPAGFLMVSAMGAAVCLLNGEWRPVHAGVWLALLYQGLIPNAAGYLLWELALHRAPATSLGLMASVTPVLSTLCLLGLFALTGQSGRLPAQWGALLLGAALVASAAVLVSIPSRWGRRLRVAPATVKDEATP